MQHGLGLKTWPDGTVSEREVGGREGWREGGGREGERERVGGREKVKEADRGGRRRWPSRVG